MILLSHVGSAGNATFSIRDVILAVELQTQIPAASQEILEPCGAAGRSVENVMVTTCSKSMPFLAICHVSENRRCSGITNDIKFVSMASLSLLSEKSPLFGLWMKPKCVP